MKNTDNLRGILAMTSAMALLSLMDMGLKLLSQHYPPLQVAALRGLASWPFVAVWAFGTVGVRALLRVRWPLHALRIALGILMMSAFVYAIRELPLSTTYSLFFVAPLLITALSGPLLGERVGARRWLAILAGFGGVLIAMRPAGGGLLSWATLAVLAAATGYAVSAITVRVLSRTDSTQAMVFWLMTGMGFGAAALAAPGWVPIEPAHWWLIGGVAVVGSLGQYAITEAFSRGEASVIAPIEYTTLAWGLGFDLLRGDRLPDAGMWLGAAIIVASGIYLMRHESKATVELTRPDPST